MANTAALVGLAFAAALGITLLVLGCALPPYRTWWPMFSLIFYLLSPVPLLIARRYTDVLESSNALLETCYFLTTGIVISAFGLPIVLAKNHVIKAGAAALVSSGNVVIFLTILAYFKVFTTDDFDYSGW
ncbi:DgyrCDS1529 [Dimorphilus gyrociliatus]|uniref:DgyrCDS1529 n=1 Tax=Dimorphilus gyrociliatus TaxID=2664684 RepID=A0A7I8VAS1_9ANNE|nr:DgyrCDS1529 [Dimorphilus gyrociliatus]